jgi:hypothetical protein
VVTGKIAYVLIWFIMLRLVVSLNLLVLKIILNAINIFPSHENAPNSVIREIAHFTF